jgi:hypothetical protein
MRWLAVCIGLLWTSSLGLACLNDRDSLAAEVQRRPDAIWIIVGRFERNPPLYYEMRIKRIEAELAKNPNQADLYDDIAVAFDRIHKDGQALLWIEKKRAVLKKMGSAATDVHDWYRYYANVGTFHAHHWFATRPVKHDELEEAEKDIAKAIELNPDAHSGREGYQLAAIQWILGNLEVSEKDRVSFADSPELKEAFANDKKRQKPEGLAGLIRLGGAWESPDIYDALAGRLTQTMRGGMLSQVAILRRDELIKDGKKPVGPISDAFWHEDGNYAKESKREFERLRADTEAWKKERDDFMIARMNQGKHPDTDSDFWEGYKERPRPDLWKPPFWETADWMDISFRIVLLIAGSAIAATVLLLIRRAVRRRRALA